MIGAIHATDRHPCVGERPRGYVRGGWLGGYAGVQRGVLEDHVGVTRALTTALRWAASHCA